MTKSWLHDVRRDCGMLWMYGPSSVGKSSIAHTISRMCHDEGLLAASFIFSRSVAGLNTEKHFMATIAYQISLSIPETRRYIAQAVESDSLWKPRTPSSVRPLPNIASRYCRCISGNMDPRDLSLPIGGYLMYMSVPFNCKIHTAIEYSGQMVCI